MEHSFVDVPDFDSDKMADTILQKLLKENVWTPENQIKSISCTLTSDDVNKIFSERSLIVSNLRQIEDVQTNDLKLDTLALVTSITLTSNHSYDTDTDSDTDSDSTVSIHKNLHQMHKKLQERLKRINREIAGIINSFGITDIGYHLRSAKGIIILKDHYPTLDPNLLFFKHKKMIDNILTGSSSNYVVKLIRTTKIVEKKSTEIKAKYSLQLFCPTEYNVFYEDDYAVYPKNGDCKLNDHKEYGEKHRFAEYTGHGDKKDPNNYNIKDTYLLSCILFISDVSV